MNASIVIAPSETQPIFWCQPDPAGSPDHSAARLTDAQACGCRRRSARRACRKRKMSWTDLSICDDRVENAYLGAEIAPAGGAEGGDAYAQRGGRGGEHLR